MSDEQLSPLLERLDRIESALRVLLEQRTVKDWYSTSDLSKILGKAEYTVREWCRTGRVRASKRQYARGAYPEWMISHEELMRIQNEGLLALPKTW